MTFIQQKKFNVSLGIVASIALALASCSTNRSTTASNDTEAHPVPYGEDQSVAKAVGEKAGASYYADIAFRPGSSQLDDNAKAALVDLIDRSLKSGTIQELKVIAWADVDYPSENANYVPSSQRDLADERGEQIKSFIQSRYESIHVATSTMARRPDALSQAFNTSDAQTKQSFEQAGISAQNAQDMSDTGIKSKAIVLSVLKP